MSNTKLTRPEILEAARKCVCGDREQDYGSPENNFQTIAAYWGQHIWVRHPELQTVIAPNALVNAVDVAVMLAQLKLARIASGHAKADNWIDLAGYAACGGEIEAEQSAPEPVLEAVPVTDEDAVKTYGPCIVYEYEDGSWDWSYNYIDKPHLWKNVKTVHRNCTVQIVTLPDGKKSEGWWHNSNPPVNLSSITDKEDESID